MSTLHLGVTHIKPCLNFIKIYLEMFVFEYIVETMYVKIKLNYYK